MRSAPFLHEVEPRKKLPFRPLLLLARFLAAAFSDGSYLAHVNGAYIRHVTFCIVRGPPLFIVSPISQRGSRAAAHFNSARLVQSPRRRR